MARVGEDGGFEELDGLRVQMDADEERLAKTLSDFDMLCAHRDAVARACQVWSECVCARATAGERLGRCPPITACASVWSARLAWRMSSLRTLNFPRCSQVLEEEERVQLRRLERLDLLVQLRALQHSQPWAPRQPAVVDGNMNPAKQHGKEALMPAHGARTRTLPTCDSDGSINKREVNADGQVARAAGRGADTRQASGHATASSQGDQPAVCVMQAQHQMPVDRLHPATREPEEQHQKGQQQSLTEERTMHANEGQGGTRAPAACSAATLSCTPEVCSASQRSAPGATNDAPTTQREAAAAEPQRAAKRTKINPMRFVCKFQLHGQCRDASCPDLHLDSPPKVCQAIAADAVSGWGNLQSVEESDTPSRGLVSGADAPAERVGECGEREAEESAGTSEPQRRRAAGGSVSDELGKLWPDFVAFSPLPADLEGRSPSSDAPSARQPRLPLGGVTIAGLAAVETRGAFAALAQGHLERDQAAEEADVSRLEEQWRATTEERYFGAMAQLSAARRKTTEEPGNIIAWLRLAQLLLQGGGGEGRASISQDLALNALSNGLDANVCSLDLWLAYLEVLWRKDGDEAAEMLEVAVQKVPLALSLWHRLAAAQPSVQMRLGVWQRAAESAAVMLVPDKQHVGMGVGLANGWRQAVAMWLQSQIAGATTLTLALRPAEASGLLSRAASRLPRVLGIHFDQYAWEGDGDGKHAVESAEEGARGSMGAREWSPEGVEREADKWKVALPVIETLCLLSVQVVSAGAMQHSSARLPVLQGRTPSTRCCGAGAGAELIVAAAAHSAHVNTHAPSACQSPPWTYAAVCLSSLTPIPDNTEDNGARQQNVGDENAAAIEAVEHASYLWRRCVASARRVGARCDESGVSPVLAEHYVTLMRRASPFRGACTARQRILASAPLGFGTLCPPQDGQCFDAPTAHKDARVLVALVRDAVLLHALPRSAPDSKEQEDAEGWELEREKEGQDLQDHNEARGLTSLRRLARAVCENSQQLKHAAQTAELTYWTSRLALIASSSFADKPSSSSASERAEYCEVHESLDAIRRGLAHVQALLAPAGASGAGQHSAGTEMGCGGSRVRGQEAGVTADIIAALSCLLCPNAGTAKPTKSGKEDEDGGEQEHETQEELCADAAEEAMWWWWSRSFVWAMLLEWRIAPLPGAPRRNLHDMSAEDADRLLAKVLFFWPLLLLLPSRECHSFAPCLHHIYREICACLIPGAYLAQVLLMLSCHETSG
jgi:hypothetical protein